MLNSLYEKTKTWGPGSCMVAFYFFSLIPIVLFIFAGSVWNIDFRKAFVSDLNLFTHSLLVSPWVETLLIQVCLTKVFTIMKCKPISVLLGVSLAFSCFHISNGLLYPFIIFLPGLMFSWNYLLYFQKNEAIWGFLSTSVLHFLYNFTIFVMIPLINVVLTTYYDFDVLK